MDNELKGTILVLMTALGSGAAVIINRFFVMGIDPTVFTAVRALMIGLAFFIFSRMDKTKSRPVSVSNLMALGVIGGGLAFLLFFNGLTMTTGGRAAFIHKTLPVWASVLAYFFLKERITRKQAGSIALALLGLGIMEFGKITVAVRLGDLLVLGATLLWALENLLAKKFMNLGETNWRVTFGRMFFGSLLLFSAVVIQDKLDILLGLQPMQWVYLGISTLMLFWYVLTWYWGLKFINLSKATGLLLTAPVISLVLGALVLSETIYPLQLLGSSFIMIGCVFLSRTRSEVLGSELT